MPDERRAPDPLWVEPVVDARSGARTWESATVQARIAKIEEKQGAR
jgi:hypothetical protein